jgi:hypothetical protein
LHRAREMLSEHLTGAGATTAIGEDTREPIAAVRNNRHAYTAHGLIAHW